MGLDVGPLRRAGLDLSLAEFEDLVMHAVKEVLPEAPPSETRQELSEAELAFLHDAGVDLAGFAPRDLGRDDPLARTAARYAAILAASLTVPQLAERLGVDQSSIRQRLAAHRLYAIKTSKSWRIPLFELDDSGRAFIPGLHLIARHWFESHPVEVDEWFTQPHPDLEGPDDTPTSPRAWLLAGGNPRVVAALAEEFDAG